MITVIDLNLIKTIKPLISEVLVARMNDILVQGKKVLLTLNRRGAQSTLVCRDCGWAARCPACDLMMRVHHTPRHILLCHFCEGSQTPSVFCPKCGSSHLVESGARVQSVAESIAHIFPDTPTLLIEKDIGSISQKSLQDHAIIIGTQKITSLPIDNIGLTAFLLVESDLAVPSYNIEEELYHQVKYFLSRSETVILQTRSPKLPFIQELTQSNFRAFFQRTIAERKQFRLPPYIQMVAIRISDDSEKTLRERVGVMASSMIESAKHSPETSIVYDYLLCEKRQGKFFQKILIRSLHVEQFLETFRKQLVRGRGIEVEWL